MFNLRRIGASSIFALALLTAFPGVSFAARNAQTENAAGFSVRSEAESSSVFGPWGQSALSFLHSLFAAEHGQVVPGPLVAPPTEPSPAAQVRTSTSAKVASHPRR
ncbi:MAG: hypothetical protein ABI639_13390 [Thermoanaerobaculia bacterium]